MRDYYHAPFYYNYENAFDSVCHPSTTYISNTGIARFFKRYLFQKAISVFEWKLPDNWTEPYYFLYCLYEFGAVAIIKTDKYGVIPQQCGLSDYGVFYQPTKAIISNPLLKGVHNLTIGTQCVVLQLMPDYGGISDLVNVYGDLLALCLEAGSVNLLNSRLSYVAVASTKAQSESFKKILDDIISGKPGAVYDKNMLPRDKTINDVFQLFNTQVGSNFITPEIMTVWSTLENMFDTEIGIPSANTEKRERMISSEIKVGSVETYSRCDMWLKLLQKRIEDAKSLFGIDDLSVDWRYDPELTGMEGVEKNGNESSRTDNDTDTV